MTGGFQQQVYTQPALGVAGDFASANPYFTVLAGPGGLVSGAAGVAIGRFAWTAPPVDPNGSNQIVNNFGAGPVAGFVHRAQQGLNTTFLSFAGMLIAPGYQMALCTGGDFLVVNSGATEAVPGQKAYADLGTGLASFAATASPSTGASATGSSIAASTLSVTGSIDDDTLTVTAVGSGTVVAGATLSGTNVVSGTKVVAQLTGTAGGVGTYLVSIPEQSVASTTISGTYGTMTVGTLTTSGSFEVGMRLNATGAVVAGTTITQILTGTGGSGSTMVVDNNTVVSSQTISAVENVETKWVAASAALPGGVVKITSQPQG